METDNTESNITCIDSMQTFPDLSSSELQNFQTCAMFNLLKPRDYFTYHQDWHSKILRGSPIAFMCFVRTSKQRVTVTLHNISRLVLCSRGGRAFTARYAMSPYIKLTLLVFKRLKIERNWKRTEFFLAGVKAQWDEGGGRILLANKAGGGALVLLEFGLQPDAFVSMFLAVHIYSEFCPAQNSTCDGRQA